MNKKVTADELVARVKDEDGENFKANWNGVWDRGTSSNAHTEDGAVIVDYPNSKASYLPPFTVGNEATSTMMLMFKCQDAIFTNA